MSKNTKNNRLKETIPSGGTYGTYGTYWGKIKGY